MKRITLSVTAIAALCMSLAFSSCVIHRDGPRRPHHKKHHRDKPPRHHRPHHPHAWSDAGHDGGTYYPGHWYA
ncbi:hypothetical protein [Marseilla massiliensis]|uniref:Lipoprotein n=1 Tax=Marseilla massiliensis TaxID=1841864 RepID=A0A938WW72_9BACT|nr:hypothetical protein [Marseilla massiliensis]MBM6674796.1 hypothetical protein [Marseilla massiliensis]